MFRKISRALPRERHSDPPPTLPPHPNLRNILKEVKFNDKDEWVIMFPSYIQFHWTSLIMKHLNSGIPRYSYTCTSKNGEVHTDSKTEKINLTITFFQRFSKKVNAVGKLHAKFHWDSSIRKLSKIMLTIGLKEKEINKKQGILNLFRLKYKVP